MSTFFQSQASRIPQNTSTLQSLLNKLIAPGDVAGNVVHDLASGKGLSGRTFLPINPFTKQDYRVRPRKVGESVGIDNPVGASLFGLGTQIFLDPTTYLGFGAVSKAGKGALFADAAIADIAKINRAIKGTRSSLQKRLGSKVIKSQTPAPFFRQTLEGQAKAGQRSFATFAGVPILPSGVSKSILSGFIRLKRGLTGERVLTGISAFDDGIAKVVNTLRKSFIPETRLRPLGMNEEDFAILQRVAVTASSRARAGENLAIEIAQEFNKEIEDLAKIQAKTDQFGRSPAQIVDSLKKSLSTALQKEAELSYKGVDSKYVFDDKTLNEIYERIKGILKETTEIRKQFGKKIVEGFYLPLILKDALIGKYKGKTKPKVGKSRVFSTTTERDLESQWRVVEGEKGKFVVNFETGRGFSETKPGIAMQFSEAELRRFADKSRRATPGEVNRAMGDEFFFEEPSLMVAVALQDAKKVEAWGEALEEVKHLGMKDYREIEFGIPKELEPYKEIIENIPEDVPLEEAYQEFIKQVAKDTAGVRRLKEMGKENLVALFEQYNKNVKDARIEKVDAERLAKLEDDLHFRFAPISIPSEKDVPKIEPTFQLPGNKGATTNAFLLPHFLESLKDGKEVVVDLYAGGGTLMPVSDKLINAGATEIHLNFFDKEKYMIQTALQNGEILEINATFDQVYEDIVRNVEKELLQSKNKEVRKIVRRFRNDNKSDVLLGSKEFEKWYTKSGFPKITQGGVVYEAWQKAAQKGFREMSSETTDPRSLKEAVQIAMIQRMAIHESGQPFIGKKGFGVTENHLKKFKKLMERDADNFRKAKNRGVDVRLHSEDGKTLIKELSGEFRGRGIVNKVVAYADPPYMRTTKTYLKQQKSTEGLEALEEYTHKEGIREIYKPFFEDIENGMDMFLTNDIDPEYIEAVIGRTSRFNPVIYTYKEHTTPTSLISTQAVGLDKLHSDVQNAKLLAGNVDVQSERGKENLIAVVKERMGKAGFEGDIRDLIKAVRGEVKIAPIAYDRILNKRLQKYEEAAKDSTSAEKFMEKAHAVVKDELRGQNNRMAGLFLRNFEEYEKIEPDIERIVAENTDDARNILYPGKTRLRTHESEALDVQLTRTQGQKIAEHQQKILKAQEELRITQFEYAALEQAHKAGRKRVPKTEEELFQKQTADIRKKMATFKTQASRITNPMNIPVLSRMKEFQKLFKYVNEEKKWLSDFYNRNLKGIRTETFTRDAKTNEQLFVEQFEHMPEAMSEFRIYQYRKEAYEYYVNEMQTFVRNIIDIETAPRKRFKRPKRPKLEKDFTPTEPIDVGKIRSFDELVQQRIGDAGFVGSTEDFFRSAKGLDRPQAPPENWIKSKVPELEGYKFPEEVAGFVDRVQMAFTNIEEIHEMMKFYDRVQGYWKKTATIANIPYHTRNAISAYVMNWYSGMGVTNSLDDYATAGNIIYKNRTGKELTGAEKELWEEFTKNGLNAQLFLGVDDMAKDLTSTLLAGKTSKTIGDQNPLFRGGAKLGRLVEDYFRFAHYVHKRRKGYGIFQSSEAVKQTHYDYAELADFERHVMRRIFPFYSWTRKNLPRALEILLTQPEKIARIEKLANAVEDMFDGEPLDPNLLPEYIANGVPVFMGKDKDGNAKYFRLKGIIPMLDIGTVTEPTKEVSGMMSPFIKTIPELGANYDLFRGRKIREYEGQTVERFGGKLKLSPEVNKIISNIRPIGEIEKITTGLSSESRGEMDVWSAVLGARSKIDRKKAASQAIYKLRLEVQAMKRDIKKLKAKGQSTIQLNNRVKRVQKDIKKLEKIR